MLHEDALDELTVDQLRECAVEADDVLKLHAGCLQRARALFWRLELEGRRLRLQHTARMWAEHGCAQRGAFRLRRRLRCFNHGAMTSVHAIEVAKRDRRALCAVRNCFAWLETPHSFTRPYVWREIARRPLPKRCAKAIYTYARSRMLKRCFTENSSVFAICITDKKAR